MTGVQRIIVTTGINLLKQMIELLDASKILFRECISAIENMLIKQTAPDM